MSERYCRACDGEDKCCGICKGTGRLYRDAEGAVVSLNTLCNREPDWAANQLAAKDAEIERLRERVNEYGNALAYIESALLNGIQLVARALTAARLTK